MSFEKQEKGTSLIIPGTGKGSVGDAIHAMTAGIEPLTVAALARRLGVKPPALCKHVGSIGDLQHRIATLAMTELGDMLRDALQGKSGAGSILFKRAFISAPRKTQA
jgi:AcrR family transcriptional regulator